MLKPMFLSGVSIVGLFLPQSASAQEIATDTQSAAEEAAQQRPLGGPGEIVVTATRLSLIHI